MVAPQSRTLVRYRNMIARQPPTLLGCAPASFLLPLEYLMALAESGACFAAGTYTGCKVRIAGLVGRRLMKAVSCPKS